MKLTGLIFNREFKVKKMWFFNIWFVEMEEVCGCDYWQGNEEISGTTNRTTQIISFKNELTANKFRDMIEKVEKDWGNKIKSINDLITITKSELNNISR